jgi:hypothetical protein
MGHGGFQSKKNRMGPGGLNKEDNKDSRASQNPRDNSKTEKLRRTASSIEIAARLHMVVEARYLAIQLDPLT